MDHAPPRTGSIHRRPGSGTDGGGDELPTSDGPVYAVGTTGLFKKYFAKSTELLRIKTLPLSFMFLTPYN